MPWIKSEYPKNWDSEIRPFILRRAGNRCENCGSENGSVRRFKKVVLTVAHLDHDHHNHEVKMDRLKCLCQACHLQYDINHHIANRKYGRNHKGKQQLKLF